jgi:hypothetical protein
MICTRNGWTLEHASERLWDDKEFVVRVCTNRWAWNIYASERLRDDEDVVLAASQHTRRGGGRTAMGVS